jgi:ribosomal protein S18 acetylase RimI-like enzyme
VIRPARPDEAGAVAALAAALFRQAYGASHPEPEVGAYFARALAPASFARDLADPRAAVLVAEPQGEAAVGYALLREGAPTAHPHAPPLGAARPLEIVRFYVDAAWHGRGVAQALMAACLDEAARRGADAVWLEAWQGAARPLAFYAKAGFAPFARVRFDFGGRVDDDVLLVRRLDGARAAGEPPPADHQSRSAASRTASSES